MGQTNRITAVTIKGHGEKTVEGMINGEWVRILSYFSDEVSFFEDEFMGMTLDEAEQLFFQKDQDYLRS